MKRSGDDSPFNCGSWPSWYARAECALRSLPTELFYPSGTTVTAGTRRHLLHAPLARSGRNACSGRSSMVNKASGQASTSKPAQRSAAGARILQTVDVTMSEVVLTARIAPR
jgi:hypothetical protein